MCERPDRKLAKLRNIWTPPTCWPVHAAELPLSRCPRWQASFVKHKSLILINVCPHGARWISLWRLSAKQQNNNLSNARNHSERLWVASVWGAEGRKSPLSPLAVLGVQRNDTVIGANEPSSGEMMCRRDVALILMTEAKVATTTHQTTRDIPLHPEGGRG